MPQQAHPPLKNHKTHFLLTNDSCLGVRGKTDRKTDERVIISFRSPGMGRGGLAGHQEELVTNCPGCLRLFALLITKHKLEQHEIMSITLQTE